MPNSFDKTIKTRIENGMIKFLLFSLNAKTHDTCIKRGEQIGRVVFLLGIRKKVVLKNLSIIYGGTKSPAEMKATAKKNYLFMGRILGELLHFKTIAPEALRDLIVPENPDIFDEINAVMKEKSVIMLSAHYGNWEIPVLYFPKYFANCCAYSGKQRNPMAEKLLFAIRSRFGTKLIPKSSGSNFAIMKQLKRKSFFMMLCDMSLSSNRLFVDMFGLAFALSPGPAYFRKRSNSAVYVAFITGKSDNRYKLSIEKLTFEAGDNDAEYAINFMAAYAKKLECAIKRHPEQYFLMHRMWKHRPPDEPNRKIYD